MIPLPFRVIRCACGTLIRPMKSGWGHSGGTLHSFLRTSLCRVLFPHSSVNIPQTYHRLSISSKLQASKANGSQIGASWRGWVFRWHEPAMDLCRERKERRGRNPLTGGILMRAWLSWCPSDGEVMSLMRLLQAAGNDRRNLMPALPSGSNSLLLLTSHTAQTIWTGVNKISGGSFCRIDIR